MHPGLIALNQDLSESMGNRGKIQEEWLDELVEFIDRIEKLEKTTIVITGGHGIRTAREDPQLNAVFIDERLFHVPL